jgi:hypothetical protein
LLCRRFRTGDFCRGGGDGDVAPATVGDGGGVDGSIGLTSRRLLDGVAAAVGDGGFDLLATYFGELASFSDAFGDALLPTFWC